MIAALLAAAGCRVHVVVEDTLPAHVEVVGPDVVTLGCFYDSAWWGPGLVILRSDGSTEQLERCNAGYSDVAVGEDGDLYLPFLDFDYGPGVRAFDPSTGAARDLIPPGAAGPRQYLGIAFGPGGDLFLGVRTGTRTSAVFRAIEEAGGSWELEEVPGTTGLGWTEFLVESDGSIVGAIVFGHQVIRVDPSGERTIVAGADSAGFGGDGGLAADALLSSPQTVELDALGNLMIVDAGNHRIRRVDRQTGVILTLVGGDGEGCGGGVLWNQPSLTGPTDVAGTYPLWIADYGCQAVLQVQLNAPGS